MWLISDANIIIDMQVGGILERMFQLPETFAVPDVLYSEELEARHSDLPDLGLAILELHPEYVDEAYRLGGIYNAPSHNDMLALALAKQENCPLLTGDERLREAADEEHIEVHGTLWLMQRLYDEGLINHAEAGDAYQNMKTDGRRLPWTTAARQLKAMKD